MAVFPICDTFLECDTRTQTAVVVFLLPPTGKERTGRNGGSFRGGGEVNLRRGCCDLNHADRWSGVFRVPSTTTTTFSIAPDEDVEIRLNGRINAVLVFGHYSRRNFSTEICKLVFALSGLSILGTRGTSCPLSIAGIAPELLDLYILRPLFSGDKSPAPSDILSLYFWNHSISMFSKNLRASISRTRIFPSSWILNTVNHTAGRNVDIKLLTVKKINCDDNSSLRAGNV